MLLKFSAHDTLSSPSIDLRRYWQKTNTILENINKNWRSVSCTGADSSLKPQKLGWCGLGQRGAHRQPLGYIPVNVALHGARSPAPVRFVDRLRHARIDSCGHARVLSCRSSLFAAVDPTFCPDHPVSFPRLALGNPQSPAFCSALVQPALFLRRTNCFGPSATSWYAGALPPSLDPSLPWGWTPRFAVSRASDTVRPVAPSPRLGQQLPSLQSLLKTVVSWAFASFQLMSPSPTDGPSSTRVLSDSTAAPIDIPVWESSKTSCMVGSVGSATLCEDIEAAGAPLL